MPLEDFRQRVEVNLISTFNMMRLAAADMAQLDPMENGERGVILSTASVSAYEGQSGEAAYSGSKGGVISMILPAAREPVSYTHLDVYKRQTKKPLTCTSRPSKLPKNSRYR